LSNKKILLVLAMELADEPRAIREVRALLSAGFSV
jgi:hypothetical protein